MGRDFLSIGRQNLSLKGRPESGYTTGLVLSPSLEEK